MTKTISQETSNNLSSVRDSYSEYMKKQYRLLHQIKREIHNWENYEYQKAQGSSLFNDDYEIYQIMLRLSHEFVENFNNRNNN